MTTLLSVVGMILLGVTLFVVLRFAYSRMWGILMIGALLIVGGAGMVTWGVVDDQGRALGLGAFFIFGGVMAWVRRKEFLALSPEHPFSKRSRWS